MKKIILTTMIVLFSLSSFSQETMKYTDNENSLIEFKISTNEYLLKVNNMQKQSLQKDKSIIKVTEISKNSVIIKDNSFLGNYENRKSKISQKLSRNISEIEPVLIYKDGIRQVCNGEIIRYDKGTSFTKLKRHSLHFLGCNLRNKIKLLCLGKKQQLWNKKSNLFVNGELESIPSQNYAKTLKSQDPLPISL